MINARWIFLVLILFGCLSGCVSLNERLKIMGPVNEGREYGSPGMPIFVSHLPKKNQAMLYRGRVPHHTMFTRLLCFKKYCRIKVGRQKPLKSMSFEKYKKKISKGVKPETHTPVRTDSVKKKAPVIIPEKPQEVPQVIDAPILKSDSLIVLGELLFATNSSTLKSEQFSTLDSIAAFLIKHPKLIVRISGHTDNTGNESHNLKLSTQRADVVAEFLVDNGVEIERVTSQGLGSARAIAPNTTDAGRRKNRRVELLIQNR